MIGSCSFSRREIRAARELHLSYQRIWALSLGQPLSTKEPVSYSLVDQLVPSLHEMDVTRWSVAAGARSVISLHILSAAVFPWLVIAPTSAKPKTEGVVGLLFTFATPSDL